MGSSFSVQVSCRQNMSMLYWKRTQASKLPRNSSTQCCHSNNPPEHWAVLKNCPWPVKPGNIRHAEWYLKHPMLQVLLILCRYGWLIVRHTQNSTSSCRFMLHVEQIFWAHNDSLRLPTSKIFPYIFSTLQRPRFIHNVLITVTVIIFIWMPVSPSKVQSLD